MKTNDSRSMPRAFTIAAVAVLFSVICAAAFVAIMVTMRAGDAQREMRQDIVLRGADAVALSFNTALRREWESLHAVANNIGDSSVEDIADFMDAVVETGDQMAWAGVADLTGTVIAGSNRLREGTNVSDRRWYREGLRRPSVGDAFISLSMPRTEDGSRERLLNMSTPVFDDAGEVTGVVVYSLRIGWVADFLTRAKEELRIDVIVQDRYGDRLVDTRPTALTLPVEVTSVTRLGRNSAGTFGLVGDDAGEGLFAYTPNFVSNALPDFGWHVFAVLDEEAHSDVLPGLLRSIVVAVAIAASFVLAVTMLALRIILRPIEALTGTARDVANGKYDYPVESRTSQEAALLSRSLARIQTDLATLKALDENPVAEAGIPGAARTTTIAAKGKPVRIWQDKTATVMSWLHRGQAWNR